MESWGKSVSVDVKNCNENVIKSPDLIKKYVAELIRLIDMKAYKDCILENFGSGNKQGYTFVQLIETSNLTGHFSNETKTAYIDIFSCKDFNPQLVADFTMHFFEGSEVTMHVALRN